MPNSGWRSVGVLNSSKPPAALALLSLIVSVLLFLAQPASGVAQQPTPTPTPTLQLSKEYIYLGGRLLATEEGQPAGGGGITPQSAGPTITSISRVPPAAGPQQNFAMPGESFTVTVTGTNLINGSTITFQPLGIIQAGQATTNTTGTPNTQLSAPVNVPVSAPQGSYLLVVSNVLGSATWPFQVGENPTSGPTTIAFDPNSLKTFPAGNPVAAQVIIDQVSGAQFTAASTVWINGSLYATHSQLASQSASQIVFNLQPAATSVPGVLEISVQTPVSGSAVQVSNSLAFPVNAPASGPPNPFPVIDGSSLTPTTMGAGVGGSVSVSSFLNSFNQNSFILVNGVAVNTTFNPPATLSTTLLPTDVPHAGSVGITVFNPHPGGCAVSGSDNVPLCGFALNTLSLQILPATPPAPGPYSIGLAGNSFAKVPAESAGAASLNITGPLTVEAWIFPKRIGGKQAIVERYDATPGENRGGYGLRLNTNGTVSFTTYQNSADFDTITSQQTIFANQWTHVAGVFDGSQLWLYIGGQQDLQAVSTCSSSCRAPNRAPAQPLFMGASVDRGPNGTDGFFLGDLDEVRVSNSVVYPGNFSPALSLPAGTGAGLWKFDDQTLNDSSGNQHDAVGKGGSIQFCTNVPGFTGTEQCSGESGGGNLPALGSITTQASANPGDLPFTLKVSGTNLSGAVSLSPIGSSQGISISTASVSANLATATVTIGPLAEPGGYLLKVGNSDGLPFIVNPVQNNPTPSLAAASLNPSTLPVGTAIPRSITISVGSGFIPTSLVQFNGNDRVTHYQDAGTLTADLLQSDLETQGTLPITVYNPPSMQGGGGGQSGTSLPFTVTGPQANPAPILNSICAGQPCSSTVQAGSGPVVMTATGSSFIPSSQIVFNEVLRSDTRYVSSTQLQLTLTNADLANTSTQPVTKTVTVNTPEPGGGISGPQQLTVNPFYPVPTITGLLVNGAAPNITAGGTSFTLQIMGTGIVGNPGQAPVTFANINGQSRASTSIYKSATELDVTIAAADIQLPGEFEVTIFTPGPGGGTSNPMMVTVNPATNPTPHLTGISVMQVQVDSTNVPAIVLTGTGFISSSQVLVNGFPRVTTFNNNDPTHLSAQLLDSDFAVLGVLQLKVSNPPPGGGTSNAVSLAVFAPPPTLNNVLPTSLNAGVNPIPNITLTGSNFIDESSVLVNNSRRGSAVVTGSGGTHLTVALTAADVASGAVLSITVSNPTVIVAGNPVGGGTTAAVSLTVNNLPPTLDPATPLTPNTITAGGGATVVISVLGTNFNPSSQVNINGKNEATDVDATHLNVTLQPSDIAIGGAITFAVFNPSPGGGTSGTAILNVTNPPPSLDANTPFAPASVLVGSLTGAQTQTITLLGTGFLPNSQVSYKGTIRASKFVDASHLTITLNAGDVATAVLVPVFVVNPAPGGGTSATATFTVGNPPPGVTGLDTPAVTTTVSPLPQITVFGSNFVIGSTAATSATAQIGSGAPHPALAGSDSAHLIMQLTAADVATAGQYAVTVTNPAPGGGPSATSTTFTVYNPPVITSLSPDNATVGQKSPPSVTVNGSGFLAGSVVMLNGFSHTPTSINSAGTQLSIQLTLDPDLSLPAGTYPVTVNTPVPGGISAAASFVLDNPVPSGSSLNPAAVTTRMTTLPQLEIVGSGFVVGATAATSATVQVGTGAPHTLLAGSDSGHLFIQLTSADVATAGSYTVTITNPPPSTGPSTVPTPLAVVDPPVITGLSPNNATVGQKSPPSVTVSGSGFLAGSVVMFNGFSHTPTSINSAGTQLSIQLTLDPDLSLPAGTYSVTVNTPVPGGVSAAASFVLDNPVPSGSSLNPAAVTTRMTQLPQLEIVGSSFVVGATAATSATVQIGTGAPHTLLAGSDSGHLFIQLTSADVAAAGSYPVTITNPPPSTGPSTVPTPLAVVDPPAITGLSPNNATVGQNPPPSVIVNGSGFLSGSVVTLNGAAHTPTVINSQGTQLTFQLTPDPDLDLQAGGYPVAVITPVVGGVSAQNANSVFTLNNPVPQMSASAPLNPASVTAGSGGVNVNVAGSGFVKASVVIINGQPLSSSNVTWISSSQLQVAIPASQTAVATTMSVVISTGAPGGGTSNPAVFTVNNPVPTLTSLSKTSVTAGSAGFTLTVTGTNFVSSSVVRVNGVSLTTTFVSPTQLNAAIPSANLASGGTLAVTVFNPGPGGGTSGTLNLNVTNPVPSISSISPSNVFAGGSAFTLTINGSNFVSNSVVSVGAGNGAAPRTTAFVSSTQLTVQMTSSDIATSGTQLTLFVTNPSPGGGSSNQMTLNVQ